MTAHMKVMRGLPGSGKTTEALFWVAMDDRNRVHVSRDSLRHMLAGCEASLTGYEDVVTTIQRQAIRELLRAGKSVVVADTNLPHRQVRELLGLAESEGATWDVHDLTDVPLSTCLQRNQERKKPVPVPVILKMHERYVKSNPRPDEWIPVGRSSQLDVEPYVADETKPLALIVDIDGTLAKMNGRGPHEYDRVGEDEPVSPVIKLVEEWWAGAYEGWSFGANDWGDSPEVILMSGRPESCREETEAWLYGRGVHWDYLFMRSDQEHKDGVADDKVKLRLFNEHVRHDYHVRAVLDDRDRVVKMWRQLGLTCLQVAEGAF